MNVGDMEPDLDDVRQYFIEGMSRISQFWGFPKAMGAIFGILYLSPDMLTLDAIGEQAGVTKGAVSTNLRVLERLGMVHRQVRLGDRKDYYLAEVDFWKIVRGILKEREKSEFDHAIRTVTESLSMIQNRSADPSQEKLAGFYQQRLQSMESFFHTLDNLTMTVLTIDELRAGAVQRLVEGLNKGRKT